MVLLPLPLMPTRLTSPFSGIVREMSLSTSRSPS